MQTKYILRRVDIYPSSENLKEICTLQQKLSLGIYSQVFFLVYSDDNFCLSISVYYVLITLCLKRISLKKSSSKYDS